MIAVPPIPLRIRFLLLFVRGYTYRHTEADGFRPGYEVTDFYMKDLFGKTYVMRETRVSPEPSKHYNCRCVLPPQSDFKGYEGKQK